MASFSTQALYGGAISANLPKGFVDASELRQIPDHQEVYLSPKTLTTIIFEINEYVSPLTAASRTNVDPSIIASVPGAGGGNEAAVSVNSTEAAAALYHLQDLIDANDTLDAVSSPRSVRMRNPGLQGLPAFTLHGKLSVREKGRRAVGGSVLPEEEYQDSNAAPHSIQTSTTIRLLLVRIEAKATDLCVTVNVPWKELEARNEVDGEEAFADAILETVIASLEIKDFGLFGE
jgi:Ran-interacting Mog1 protein